jgi:hypothetical protein
MMEERISDVEANVAHLIRGLISWLSESILESQKGLLS